MSGVTELDLAGAKRIAGWEGGQSPDGLYRAYWDPYGHVWTIGCGQTSGVHEGMVWTPEQAWANLLETFARDYAPYINQLGVDLNQNEFDAIGDTIWNTGPGALEWEWGQALRRGEFADAAALLRDTAVTAGGVRLQGLVNRRTADAALLLTPEPIEKPADPYAMYPDDTMTFGGYTFRERVLAETMDRAIDHPHISAHKLHQMLPAAVAVRKRIWVVSVFEAPDFKTRRPHADWGGDERGARYQAWSARINRAENVLR